MKIFITISLLVAIFLQTFSLFVIQAEYFLNKNYIARELCVNKDKPKMHCNGKCCLARQLKQQEKQDQQIPGSKKEKFEVQPFFLPKTFSFVNIQLTAKAKYFYKQRLMALAFVRPIFHPPSA